MVFTYLVGPHHVYYPTISTSCQISLKQTESCVHVFLVYLILSKMVIVNNPSENKISSCLRHRQECSCYKSHPIGFTYMVGPHPAYCTTSTSCQISLKQTESCEHVLVNLIKADLNHNKRLSSDTETLRCQQKCSHT